MAEPLLQIKNLIKYYGKGESQVKALDDISFPAPLTTQGFAAVEGTRAKNAQVLFSLNLQ